MIGMRRPIFVRPISDAEREALEDGLRSSDAFILRRCQILLASSRGENAYRIARSLGCDSQTARTAIKRFNEGGLQEALRKRSSRPKKIRAAFDGGRAEQLREMLHRSPREFEGHEPVDTRFGRRSELRGGDNRRAGERGDRACHPEAHGSALAARQALDHQPRPRVRKKKGAATG